MTKLHNYELDNNQIRTQAPSVFSENPYHEVSEKYKFIPTIEVIDALRSHGWKPVDATQKNVRTRQKVNFTKHLIRFRRLGDDIVVGDSVVEIILTNSHDRSSGFILHAGIFRMACANGIVTDDATFGRIAIRHSGDAPEQVIEGSYKVIDEVPTIVNSVEKMQSVKLNYDEKLEYAGHVLDLILPDRENISTEDNLLKKRIITPKRSADLKDDLWTVYNVAQEKVLKGGIKYVKMNEKRGLVRNTTRAIKSIDRNIKINKDLWSVTTDFMKAA